MGSEMCIRDSCPGDGIPVSHDRREPKGLMDLRKRFDLFINPWSLNPKSLSSVREKLAVLLSSMAQVSAVGSFIRLILAADAFKRFIFLNILSTFFFARTFKKLSVTIIRE